MLHVLPDPPTDLRAQLSHLAHAVWPYTESHGHGPSTQAKALGDAPIFVDTGGASPTVAQRLAVYRRSVLGTLHQALETTYPIVLQLVGGAYFRALARSYIANHPSQSGDLNEYGGAFAEHVSLFLAARGDDRETLRYLPDVARLEWLAQTVYYAADAVPDLGLLGQAQDPSMLRFALHPAHARLDSPYALDAIWRVHAPDHAGDRQVALDEPTRVLVFRRHGQVVVHGLSVGEALFCDALAASHTLHDAVQSATQKAPDFDLTTTLAWLMREQLLVRAWID